MEGVFFIGSAVAGLLYVIAGDRLLWLSLHTGEAPERMLGGIFLLWGVFYLLDIAPALLSDESLLTPFYFAGRVAAAASIVVFAWFTRRVFRPTDPWAGWLIVGVAFCVSAGIAGSIWIGDPAGIRPLVNPWYWLEALGNTGPFVWMAAEAFAQYGKAKRRLRLNLCDPAVCNRYLLWGLTSALWFGVEVVVNVQTIGYQLTNTISARSDLLIMAIELASISLVWLVFFPPAAYRRWIESQGPTSLAGER